MKRGSGALALCAAAVLLAAAAARSAPQVPSLLPVDAGLVSSFAFDPRDPNIVYVGTVPGANKGRVYKTTDGGEHWRLVSGRGWTWLGALAADPRRRGTLYAGTGNAVYKTTNGGRTWRAFDRGLLPPPGINRGEGWVDWLAVDPTNSNVLYEHDYANTIRKSVDGGQSWRPMLSLYKKGWIASVLLAPSRPSSLYAAFWRGSFEKWSDVVDLGVYKSSDGAKTWQRTMHLSVSREHSPVVALAADPRRPTVLYAVVGTRVFRSTDAGHGWSFIGEGLPQGGDVTGLAAARGTVYAAFGEKGIYASADGGRTWTQSWPDSGPAPGLGAGLLAVDPARPTTIYASAYYPQNRRTGTHILRSTDSGRTWTGVG